MQASFPRGQRRRDLALDIALDTVVTAARRGVTLDRMAPLDRDHVSTSVASHFRRANGGQRTTFVMPDSFVALVQRQVPQAQRLVRDFPGDFDL